MSIAIDIVMKRIVIIQTRIKSLRAHNLFTFTTKIASSARSYLRHSRKKSLDENSLEVFDDKLMFAHFFKWQQI